MIPIFYAVDTDDFDAEHDRLTVLGDHVDVKFGPAFVYAHGWQGCNKLAVAGTTNRRRLRFIDLKIHDISATVGGGTRSIIKNFYPDFISLHACDGYTPLLAAVNIARECEQAGYRRPMLLGVTVLTSVDKHYVGSMAWEEYVRERAIYARTAGLDGVICAANAIPVVKAATNFWKPFQMVPGLRSAGVGADDQKNVATPREALEAGADAIVMGRELRLSPDPLATVLAIKESLT